MDFRLIPAVACLLLFLHGASAQLVNPRKPPQWLTDKLEKTIIPHLELREATLVATIEFIRSEAKLRDPQKVGAPIFVQIANQTPVLPGTALAASNPADTRLTVSLTNIPVSEALRYITNLAGVKYRVWPDGVHIVAITDPDPIYTHTFLLNSRQRDRLDRQMKAAEEHSSDAEAHTAQRFLINSGVVFLSGTNATLNEANRTLVVRNTFEQLELIELVLDQLKFLPPEELPIPGPEVPKVLNWPAEGVKSKAEETAERIILHDLILDRSSLDQAISKLEELSIAYDPLRHGLRMRLIGQMALAPGNPADQSALPRFNYSAKRVQLIEAIRKIAELAGVKFAFYENEVHFGLSGSDPNRLFTVEYLVHPEIAIPPRKISPAEEFDSKDWLKASGVIFGPRASAIYDPSSNKLIVQETLEEQRVVRKMVEDAWREYYEKHPQKSSGIDTQAPLQEAR